MGKGKKNKISMLQQNITHTKLDKERKQKLERLTGGSLPEIFIIIIDNNLDRSKQ